MQIYEEESHSIEPSSDTQQDDDKTNPGGTHSIVQPTKESHSTVHSQIPEQPTGLEMINDSHSNMQPTGSIQNSVSELPSQIEFSRNETQSHAQDIDNESSQSTTSHPMVTRSHK